MPVPGGEWASDSTSTDEQEEEEVEEEQEVVAHSRASAGDSVKGGQDKNDNQQVEEEEEEGEEDCCGDFAGYTVWTEVVGNNEALSDGSQVDTIHLEQKETVVWNRRKHDH